MSGAGCTVSFREVVNFDKLSLKDATDVIYNELIPACEKKGIMLSQNGDNSCSDQARINEYYEQKFERKLFDVKRIQKAFALLPKQVRRTSQYVTYAGNLKHDVEKHPLLREYISGGDMTAAMLLKDHKARFQKRDGYCDCMFQVKFIKYPGYF